MADQEKRKFDQLTPPVSDVVKRYTWNPENLIKNNPYYPLANQQSDDVSPTPPTPKDSSKDPKTTKVPPIFIHNANNHREIIADIKKITEDRDFTTALTSKYLKVNLTSHDDYRALTKYYMNNLVQFHTFQNPNEKPLSVVIKNVPLSLTEDEVKKELLAKNLPITSVTRLLSKDKKAPIPICAVILTSTEAAKEIYNLRTIFHSIVTVEARKKASNIPQCHKCQRYGHTKNYCAAKSRCVKCQEDHLPQACKKTSNDPPKCVNCGGNHPASYRGCPHHLELQRKRMPSMNIRSTRQQPNYSNAPNSIPYNQVLHSNRNQNNQTDEQTPQPPQPPQLDSVLQFIKDLIIPLLPQIKSFILTHILPNILNG